MTSGVIANPFAAGRRGGGGGRRLCLMSAGFCCSAVAVAFLILLILAFTAFKVKKPTLTVSSVAIRNLSVSPAVPAPPPTPISINVTAVAAVAVDNPNAAAFEFSASATTVYYRQRSVAVAYAPPGEAPARGSVGFDVTVDVMADHVAGDASLAGDVAAGRVTVTTSTEVRGTVKVLGFRKHVDVQVNCSITVALASRAVTDQSCDPTVRL